MGRLIAYSRWRLASILLPHTIQKVARMSSENANPPAGSSGKRLTLAVILLALLAAGASWWFRYAATHRAAQFWGPQAAPLIRDGAHVTLRSDAPSPDAAGTEDTDVPRDISAAKGLTHLRNALLEDASYDWSAQAPADADWSSSLVFAATEGSEPRAVVLFSPDYKWLANGSAGDPAKRVAAATDEFAAGLRTFFADVAAAPAEQ
jgi:hypothetical protein